MRIFTKSLYRFVLALGVKPNKAVRILAPGRYADSLRKWKQSGGDITKTYKILTDSGESAGMARGHYFHQDIWVARLIHEANPERHIDVGSRIDDFVAHVAAFRKIEVMDIRPLGDVPHENMNFIQHDLMELADSDLQTDSISCLHAIEHFGLGSYGDPINPQGHMKAFKNMISMPRPGGTLYISFRIADQDEVHFNAHRVFPPTHVFDWPNANRLSLKRFDYVGDDGDLNTDEDPRNLTEGMRFAWGIYCFEKH